MSAFTPSHRAGAGPPLVCLHGFADTWRTWELVLPALEREHDALALTLPGHAGGPPLDGPVTTSLMPDAVERAMDEAGIGTAHLTGNSLGAFTALQLAERGRALSVVAFAPAGGWAPGDTSYRELLHRQAEMPEVMRAAAPHAPPGLAAHQMLGASLCDARPLIECALRDGYPLDVERITCPLRIVWGTEDPLLPWPSAAARYLQQFPAADWVELDGVGHAPQTEVPLEAAQLILGFTR